MTIVMDSTGQQFMHTSVLIPLDLHAECKSRKINLSEITTQAIRERLQNE
jgi:post-segregation antitoxin (ccd killing protein)